MFFNFLVRTDNFWHSMKVPDCTLPTNYQKYFQHPFDCSKYYRCDDNNKLRERNCTDDLFWNQETSSCEAETSCEAISLTDSSKANIEPYSVPSRRYNASKNGCDHHHHNNGVAERKPSIRKYAGFFDDDSDESISSWAFDGRIYITNTVWVVQDLNYYYKIIK